MKKTGILMLASLLLLSGCGAKEPPAAAPAETTGYRQIDQETAKEMLAQEGGPVLVDVRRFDEYVGGHIPGAICIPNESIADQQPEELPNREQPILIYCRSGNRSKQAAEKLAELGYTEVYEFGGINDWTGEVTAGQTLMLTLESNPTTGYCWAAEQEPALFSIREAYVAEPQEGPVSGAGGWQTFVLTPRQAGTAELVFTYARSWEPSDTDPQLRCTVEIAEDLTLTVTENDSDTAAQGYAPVLRVYG
ncbi:MAG: protease inhibitor I42 family protein [Oscillospiraceae bacterium]|nr:protease inhibitor I42 family protein [Oscillospiraceae bacterium]